MPNPPEHPQNNFTEDARFRGIDPAALTHLISFLREQQERDLERLTSKFDESVGRVRQDMREDYDELWNKTDAIESKLNNKLESFDQALRGNGRVGVFEQIRGIKTSIKVIFTCLMLLFGFKVWGYGFDEYFHGYFWPAITGEEVKDVSTNPAPLQPTPIKTAPQNDKGKGNQR